MSGFDRKLSRCVAGQNKLDFEYRNGHKILIPSLPFGRRRRPHWDSFANRIWIVDCSLLLLLLLF